MTLTLFMRQANPLVSIDLLTQQMLIRKDTWFVSDLFSIFSHSLPVGLAAQGISLHVDPSGPKSFSGDRQLSSIEESYLFNSSRSMTRLVVRASSRTCILSIEFISGSSIVKE